MAMTDHEHMIRPKGSSGFTLFELMVTMAVVGIVLAIGMPSFSDILRSQRVKAASVAVMTTLSAARSEAVRFGVDVSIVAPSNDFNDGWCVVFGSTAACDLTAPAVEVMRVQPPIGGVTMPTGQARVVVSRAGRLAGALSVPIADDLGVLRRCVLVEVSGAVTSREPSGGVCP